jgi:hypothetical protein
MAHMDDLDCTFVDDAVENLVAIAAHDLHSNVRIAGLLGGLRLFGNQMYAGIDRTQTLVAPLGLRFSR